MVKIAVNGFGRIGRLAFRQMFETEGYEVVAINDLMEPEMPAHLPEYDTSQRSLLDKIGEGKYAVEVGEDSITVGDKKITIYKEADVKNFPWKVLNVDVVLECTNFCTSKEGTSAHLEADAKKVVISAPTGNNLPTIVFDVNEKTLTKEDKIISATSCTTSCLVPMARALGDYTPIQPGIMGMIYAYIGNQMILDGPQREGDLRRSRIGAANIVPNSTGAAKAIDLVTPRLNGKFIDSAQRVPVTTGSTTVLVAVIAKDEVTKEEINAVMKAATNESSDYNTDEIVPSDTIDMCYGSLFGAAQTMVSKIAGGCYQVQIVPRYDNENSYTNQVVRTIEYFAEL